MRRVAAALVLLMVAACTSDDGRPKEHSGPWKVPRAIASDCSAAVDGRIMEFLATVPKGSTVVFEKNGCYGQDRTITLEDRTDLTIDGNGATFKKRIPTTKEFHNPNWRIAGGKGVTLKNMTIRGSYNPPPRGSPGQGQAVDHGLSLWGATKVSVLDVEISNVDGECLTADSDIRKGTDYRFNPPSRDITVDRLRCSHTARQGVAATAVDGFTFSNSSIDDTQQTGLDIEIDVGGQLARNVKILKNTFGATLFSAIAVPTGNYPDVGDILIKGNVMTRAPETCLPAIYVGDVRVRLGALTIVENTLLSIGDGVLVVHTDNSEVSRNRLRKTDPGGAGCDNSQLSPPHPVPVRTVDANVRIEGNTIEGYRV